MLKVLQLSLELIAELRPTVNRIRKYDRFLANQLCRAASWRCSGSLRARGSEDGRRRGLGSFELASFPNLSVFEGAFFEGPTVGTGIDADVQIYGASFKSAAISVAGMLQARLVGGTAMHVATARSCESTTRREVEFLLQPRTARVGVVVAAIREVGDLRARVGIGLFVVIAGGAAAARRRKSTEQGENSPANGRRAAHQLVTARENFRIGNRRSRCRLGIRAGVRIRDRERG